MYTILSLTSQNPIVSFPKIWQNLVSVHHNSFLQIILLSEYSYEMPFESSVNEKFECVQSSVSRIQGIPYD